MLQNTKGEIKGTVLGLVSAIIGGVCPVYWKQIKVINSAVILCYRVVLVCVCMFLICLLLYGWEQTISPLRRKGAVRRFLITGTIMVSNWGVYVWSVNSGHIIQASIGYYIMPLIVCLIGMIIFHEPVTKIKFGGVQSLRLVWLGWFSLSGNSRRSLWLWQSHTRPIHRRKKVYVSPAYRRCSIKRSW